MKWVHVLVGALLLMPLRVDASDFFGPIRIRDLSPMSSLRLDMMPPHACHDDRWEGALRLDYSAANVFIMTDNVAEFLRERKRATPLTGADVKQLLDRSEGDVFFYDAEVTLVDVEYIHQLDERWYARVEWPLMMRSGGAMDRGIERFHEAAGLNSANRDVISRDDVHIVARIDGQELVMLDRGAEMSVGDPVLAAGFAQEIGRRLFVVGEAAVKIPLGDRRRYFSSGRTDVGAQLALQRFFRSNALYAGVNYVWTGRPRVLETFHMSNAWTAGAAWETRVGRKSWFLSQATWSGGAIEPEIDSTFTGDRIQVTIGLRRLFATNLVSTLALTENLVHFKTTPDVGVHLAVSWLIPNHPRRSIHE